MKPEKLMQPALTFIDEPRWMALEIYQEAIQQMTDSLSRVPGIISIYQIGGLSAPGISDIDMVVVFEDDVICHQDPRKRLDPVGRYLFIHPLYATSISLFKRSRDYTFFHNFKLLYGKDLNTADYDEGDSLVQLQWAYEFLIKMMINLVVGREYGVCKVRSLLLQVRALLYDIQLFDDGTPEIRDYIEEIVAWRSIWFQRRPQNGEIHRIMTGLEKALTEFIEEQLKKFPIYLPEREKYFIEPNIELHYAERLGASLNGVKLPIRLSWTPKRYVRKIISLRNRINKFNIHIPFQNQQQPCTVAKAFDYMEHTVLYNRCRLPYFMPLTSSLMIMP